MLEVSLLGVGTILGTVLRLERGAWSMVQLLRQAAMSTLTTTTTTAYVSSTSSSHLRREMEEAPDMTRMNPCLKWVNWCDTDSTKRKFA